MTLTRLPTHRFTTPPSPLASLNVPPYKPASSRPFPQHANLAGSGCHKAASRSFGCKRGCAPAMLPPEASCRKTARSRPASRSGEAFTPGPGRTAGPLDGDARTRPPRRAQLMSRDQRGSGRRASRAPDEFETRRSAASE